MVGPILKVETRLKGGEWEGMECIISIFRIEIVNPSNTRLD